MSIRTDLSQSVSTASRLRRLLLRTSCSLAVIGLAFAALSGCGGGKQETSHQGASAPAGAVSDTAAYKTATELPDTTARITALEGFLKTYPDSPFRGGVYARLAGLMAAKTPGEVIPFLRSHLGEKDPDTRTRLYSILYEQTQDKAPADVPTLLNEIAADSTLTTDVYNSVAWDLVERNGDLDMAVRLAALGVERAPDSTSKASVLDTEGWAHYARGDYEKAVVELEQAVALRGDPEVRAHLASAYDKAGHKAQARDLYEQLMVSEEDPDWRGRLEALTRDLKGSVAELNHRIDQKRAENSKPAADFTLKDYDGKDVRLADFKGKVVLLDFWHPT